MQRVHFETHAGQRILCIDCTGLDPRELMEVFDDVRDIVTAQPASSVMTLTDFTNAQFDKGAADHLKLVAAYDRPHVRRAAIVGAATLPDVYYRNLVSFSAREFPVFRTREEALAYLLAEPAAERQTA
jgi:hypothetical protein